MKFALLFLASIIGALLWANTASAHVLITNTTESKGLVLHIMPDDDPVAGEPSTLYFDFGAGSANSAELTITDELGGSTTLQTEVQGTLATFEYVFPYQGVYKFTLNTTSNGQPLTFHHSERVSRGAVQGVSRAAEQPWAEALLIACGTAFMILLIIFINRFKEIMQQSTF